MSVRLRNQTPMLRVLCKSSPKVARDIIKTADNALIKCICECSHNLLRGNISVSSKKKSKLKRHKKALRDIAKKKVSLKRKRKIIQTGGFVVERFNRTLKTRMWRYFTAKNRRKYLNILQDLVHSYNHSFHRSIKRTPASVSLENQEVWQTLYGCPSSVRLPKIAQGSLVKISKVKGCFHKG